MIKSKLIKLIVAIVAGFLISCNTTNNSGLEQAINEMKDGQQVILKKIATLEKSINNLALANKNRPADKNKPADKKQPTPPQADPNKVYNIPIGDSFSTGPVDAAVTIIEWMDFQ